MFVCVLITQQSKYFFLNPPNFFIEKNNFFIVWIITIFAIEKNTKKLFKL